MEASSTSTAEQSSAVSTQALTRTIAPSQILTPDMDVYYNSFRIDQQQNLPHQSPPVPHRTMLPTTVQARRMRSISASAAFESTLRMSGPVPALPIQPNNMTVPFQLNSPVINRMNGHHEPVNGDVQMMMTAMDKDMADPMRSPRMRKLSLPLSPSTMDSNVGPLSPRGEGIPTEIPGSPKRKRYTVTAPDGNNPASPSNGKKRRQRQKKTPTQVAVLERHFVINPHPDKQTRDTLALQLGFTSRQVQIWFQNARAKAKQNARKNGLDAGSTSPMMNGHTNHIMTPPQLGHKPIAVAPSPQTPGTPNSVSPGQTPPQLPNGMVSGQPAAVTHGGMPTNGGGPGGGRKIFSPPPPFSPPSAASSPSSQNSPPLSPSQQISPFLSSLALSPRFPTRTIHPVQPLAPIQFNAHHHLINHQPPTHNINNNINNNSMNFHQTADMNHPTETHIPTTLTDNGLSDNLNDDDDSADLHLDPAVLMDDTPQTPPIFSLSASAPVPTTAASSSSSSNAVPMSQPSPQEPLSPPPPCSPLDDFPPTLSMSAPAPFSVFQKQMMDEHSSSNNNPHNSHNNNGYRNLRSSMVESPFHYHEGKDSDSHIDEDDFFSSEPPSSPPNHGAAFDFSLMHEEAAASVFLSAQNQKAALQLLPEFAPFQFQQHSMQQQAQHQQQQQQQQQQHHSMTTTTSEMDFLFYEAPSKNLVHFGDTEGDGDVFWGNMETLNP